MNDPRAMPHRAMRSSYGVIALAVIAFILYGSLYPFEFHARSWPGGTLAHLLGTWTHWDRPGDLLSNILLYSPLGFFGVCALARPRAGVLRILLVIAGGVALSACMELAQFYDRGRDSTLGDVYANAIGTTVGAVLATSVRAGMRWPLVGQLVADKPAALVLLAWFGYRLYPYVPTIDLHKYTRAVAGLVFDPTQSAEAIARFLLAWLLVGTIIRLLYGYRPFLILFPLVAGSEFVGRVLVIDATLTLKDIAGAIGAFTVGVPLLRMAGRVWIVAVAFACLILFERLTPFQFAAAPLRPFGWVPFLSFMHGSIGVDMQAFWEKFFAYGGLIWLLRKAGLGVAGATVLTAGLLAFCGWAQTYLPDRSAEVTDAIMAFGIGGVFALVSEPARDGGAGPE